MKRSSTKKKRGDAALKRSPATKTNRTQRLWNRSKAAPLQNRSKSDALAAWEAVPFEVATKQRVDAAELRRGDALDEVVLLALAFSADGERVEQIERQRILDGLTLAV